MVIEDVPIPDPEPDEVRLRVESVGIDGGLEALVYDWHSGWHHVESDLPRIFGHEFAGVVDTVGDDVTRFSGGERVAVEPGASCGRCRYCLGGEMNLCQTRVVTGLDRDGALAEYTTVPERSVYPIDDDVPFDEAAYLEVLAIGVNMIEYSRFKPGDDVAVSGPGPVGLSAVIAAATGGAGSLAVVGADVDTDSRLPIAREMGATKTINIEEESLDEQVDLWVEASGHQSALERAVDATRPGGQIIQIGVFHGEDTVPVDVNHLVRNGIAYRPMRARRDSSWRRTVSIAGQVDLSPIVGPTFDLADHEAAFEAVRNRAGMKIILHP